MILYLLGTSKNKIGYTPDVLTINNKGRRYVYDIDGWIEYEKEDLYTRTKGVLYILNKETEEYVEMTKRQERRLLELLKDAKSEIIVSIYPQSIEEDTDENVQLVRSDVITNTKGELELQNQVVNFTFTTECYY